MRRERTPGRRCAATDSVEHVIDSPAIGVQGVRITPHVFIRPTELDVLVKALSEIARA